MIRCFRNGPQVNEKKVDVSWNTRFVLNSFRDRHKNAFLTHTHTHTYKENISARHGTAERHIMADNFVAGFPIDRLHQHTHTHTHTHTVIYMQIHRKSNTAIDKKTGQQEASWFFSSWLRCRFHHRSFLFRSRSLAGPPWHRWTEREISTLIGWRQRRYHSRLAKKKKEIFNLERERERERENNVHQSSLFRCVCKMKNNDRRFRK